MSGRRERGGDGRAAITVADCALMIVPLGSRPGLRRRAVDRHPQRSGDSTYGSWPPPAAILSATGNFFNPATPEWTSFLSADWKFLPPMGRLDFDE